ncbi:MAG TPA: CYTH domain-containing protein [Candidatus Absconditabacterales bacterium]|nr:CYTH domain-containing protein [Candidatus Absconditabacterales bacterium]HNG97592.1 CYTH domain-containing protein [Candidatus Absconditabacterales bacterium]
MNYEYEIKVLAIDIENIQKKLQELGAQKQGTYLMKRYVFDMASSNNNSCWIRLRDDGRKVTLTIKEVEHDGIDGTKEWEIIVDSFETTFEMIQKLGYTAKAYQENRRTSYTMGNVFIEIDERPMIPPYVEIEGPSIESVENLVGLLGFEKKDTTSINTSKIYLTYGIELDTIKELRFQETLGNNTN